MLKILFFVIGCVSLALGAVGIVLPLLPTTPFVLLAVVCFARSSERCHNYVMNHRLFGPYITNYSQHTMATRDKICTLTLMWIGMCLSIVLIHKLIPTIILLLIAVCVTVHIVRLRPVRARQEKAGKQIK